MLALGFHRYPHDRAVKRYKDVQHEQSAVWVASVEERIEKDH